MPDLNPLEWGGVLLYASLAGMAVLVVLYWIESVREQMRDARFEREWHRQADEALRQWQERRR